MQIVVPDEQGEIEIKLSRYHYVMQLFGSFTSIGSYILCCYLLNISPSPDWKFGLLVLGVGVIGIVTIATIENRRSIGKGVK